MKNDFHIEFDCYQKYADKEVVSGDVFLVNREQEEGRTVLILSDGLGHGIKAHVQAMLTASMVMDFTKSHTDPEIAANIISRTLPSDEKRSGFATFSVITIESDGTIRIENFENPFCIILRGNEILEDIKWQRIPIEGCKTIERLIYKTEFVAGKEDRIIFFTDGIIESGMGTVKNPKGWGTEKLAAFALNQVDHHKDISATSLTRRIVNQAAMNDGYVLKDDCSCGVVYVRTPRLLNIVTGPPFFKDRDADFARKAKSLKGKKILMGGTTGEILSRELGIKIQTEYTFTDSALPPKSLMEGFDLVTEGILTLTKVEQLLEAHNAETRLGNSPAEEIVKSILQHDRIQFIVGTRINWAHQNPDQKEDIEIRKNVIIRLIRLLRDKFFKEVEVEFF